MIRLAGIDLVVSTGPGTVGAGDVFAAALFGALVGWLAVRLLERHSRRPQAHWPIVGSTGLAVSIIGPSWLADGASAVALIALHIVTAVVVIRGFAPTVGRPQGAGVGSRRATRARTSIGRRSRRRPGTSVSSKSSMTIER
jgi:hypothetical protein